MVSRRQESGNTWIYGCGLDRHLPCTTSWPGSTRPSIPLLQYAKTKMPGASPGMTEFRYERLQPGSILQIRGLADRIVERRVHDRLGIQLLLDQSVAFIEIDG